MTTKEYLKVTWKPREDFQSYLGNFRNQINLMIQTNLFRN